MLELAIQISSEYFGSWWKLMEDLKSSSPFKFGQYGSPKNQDSLVGGFMVWLLPASVTKRIQKLCISKFHVGLTFWRHFDFEDILMCTGRLLPWQNNFNVLATYTSGLLGFPLPHPLLPPRWSSLFLTVSPGCDDCDEVSVLISNFCKTIRTPEILSETPENPQNLLQLSIYIYIYVYIYTYVTWSLYIYCKTPDQKSHATPEIRTGELHLGCQLLQALGGMGGSRLVSETHGIHMDWYKMCILYIF